MRGRIGIFLFLLVSITTVFILQNFESSVAASGETCATERYIVQEGDNLGKIAWKFGISLQQLLDANNLANHADYYVGQELIIPNQDCASASNDDGPTGTVCDAQQTYVVQEGDNLGKIAWKFGVTLKDLIAINNLANHTDYYVGQTLIIPLATCEGGGGGEPAPFQISYRERFGIAGAAAHAAEARHAGLDFGAFVSWNIHDASSVLPGIQTDLRIIRLSQAGVIDSLEAINASIAAQRGATWIIGNEMDVIWQDNVTPERYATYYHDLYQHIKQQDPTAQIAIGAIATPTPLRRAYLDLVLDAYQTQYGAAMPIDVWTIHTYILREERNSWGAEIPPGMPTVNEGMLYELDDHGDVQEMTRLIGEFRQWMADNGYQDAPLLITEMGILMPADFGFPPEVVAEYMQGLVNYLLNTKDAETGYPQDGNRLVQQWFWFSVWDVEFSVSNLYDRANNTVTPVGWAYTDYLR